MAVIELTDTWLIEDYANVFAAAVKDETLESPFLSSLEHFRVPGVKWRLSFFARGDEEAKPNCASIFLQAVFDREAKNAVSSVLVEWDLHLIIADVEKGRSRRRMELTEYLPKQLSANKESYDGWGWANAFQHIQLDRAVKAGSLEMKVNLRIFNVVDLLKCRESLRGLFADPRHSDITLKAGDKDFRVHRAILCASSDGFTDAFLRQRLLKVRKITDVAPHTLDAFLRAFHFVNFNFLTVWKLTLDVLEFADKFSVSNVAHFCDLALEAAIPTMSLADVFRVLPVVFRCDDVLSAKAACVLVLKREERWIDSPEWSAFKAENDGIAFDMFEQLVRAIKAGEKAEETSGVRVVELQLQYTWVVPGSQLTPPPPSLTSPFCLEHKAFPGVKWEAELFPQGNAKDPEYKPGHASLYLKAVFEVDATSVAAKWKATLSTSNGRLYAVGTPEFVVYAGVKEMKFGYVNAFKIEHLNATVDPDKQSLPIRFDLTVASIPEIAKSRDLISRLDTDKDFADVEIDVGGTIFKSHKCVLAVRSPTFAAMFETEMRESKTSKVEVKETTAVAFKHFLSAVYYASWEFLSDMDATLDVLALAERYGVADLKRYCDEALAHFVNATNLFDVLTHAAMHNAEATKAACVEILFANEQMTKSSGWRKFKKSVNTEIMADIAEAIGERYRKGLKRKREED